MNGVAVVHAVHQASQLSTRPDAFTPALAVLHVAAIPLAVWKPRLAMAAVALLGTVQCALAFPRTATHLFLGVAASLMLAALEPDDPLLRRAAIALPLIAFSWSGVQKAIHGYWFDGQMLAWAMVARDDVAATLLPVLDASTVKQLGALDRNVEGSGPFVLTGGWVVLSNLIWSGELVSPLLAVWKPVRAQLWWVLLVLTWGIQLVAHEVQFGLLLSNLVLVAAPAKVQWPLRGAVVAGCCALVVFRLGASS